MFTGYNYYKLYVLIPAFDKLRLTVYIKHMIRKFIAFE